jgi:hypothetical protein
VFYAFYVYKMYMTHNYEDLSRVIDLQEHDAFRNTNAEDTVYFSSFRLDGLPPHNHVVANIAAFLDGAPTEIAQRLVSTDSRHYTAAEVPVPRSSAIFAYLSTSSTNNALHVEPLRVIDNAWQPGTEVHAGYRRTVAKLLMTATEQSDRRLVVMNLASTDDPARDFYDDLGVKAFHQTPAHGGFISVMTRQSLAQRLTQHYDLQDGRLED